MPHSISLSKDWRLSRTAAGAWATPAEIDWSVATIPAPVPGTVAQALEDAGQFDRNTSLDLDQQDCWYVCDLTEAVGPATLAFAGLATVADVYLNGAPILQSDSMFLSHKVPVTLTGKDQLALCFRALGPVLARKQPRQRWRTSLINNAGLRTTRTTALGRMPGWCPEIHAVGPWREIRLERQQAIENLQITSSLQADGTGRLTLSCQAPGVSTLILSCAGSKTALQKSDDGLWTGTLDIANVELWWPATHGRPVLHDITLIADSAKIPSGHTGFRSVTIDRGADGNDFAIHINGEKIFCRGAVWTTTDIVSLSGSRKAYAPFLELAACSGINMIRIAGTGIYETADFFALCDELGLMVWQEAMLANFDYPAGDAAFIDKLTGEADQLLARTALSPSLTVFCGGSEVYQQAAMMGMPKDYWSGPITEDILPTIVAARRPDIAYVPNSPSGGAMPFAPNCGVGHYYGVGAYCRPLDDARRANLRFAAECLAFAHVPEQAYLDAHLPVAPVHDPRWKARVPRDRGASWDFEDIRDHYLQDLYGFEPNRLRRENPALYLDLSRAVTGEVLEACFAEWRRAGSSCNGAMILTLQDLLPGPGWGLINPDASPKPVWHALARASRPVQILLSDEGTNGLDVHIINETAETLDVTVELACLRDGKLPVVSGKRQMTATARSAQKLAATDLFGAFFDTTYVFRFGPPAHDVTVATLKNAAGDTIATAFHFPQGRAKALHPAILDAKLEKRDAFWSLSVSTNQLAQNVHLHCPGFAVSDNWFHLSPTAPQVVTLTPLPDTPADALPSGEIQSLGSSQAVRF